MPFTILYFTTSSGRSPVETFINAQGQQTSDKIYEVVEYLKVYGFHLPTTYLRRLSGSHKLWELRVKYHAKQYRIFLAKGNEQTIILFHVIVKKTPKTPKHELQTAQERLKLFEKGEL